MTNPGSTDDVAGSPAPTAAPTPSTNANASPSQSSNDENQSHNYQYSQNYPSKPYKQYNNQQRQGNYRLGPGNYNNNRKNYNQKVNHGNNQYASYNNYPQNYANPPYGYYGYPYGYQGMVPGMTMPVSVPNAYSPQAAYSPVANTSGSSPVATHASLPPNGRVKITDKDGKSIDLEEKKAHTASSTPKATNAHLSSVASPLKTSNPVSPALSKPETAVSPAPVAAPSVASPAPAPVAPAADQTSHIEAFKRKVQERARLLAEKKKQEAEQKAKAEQATATKVQELPKAENVAESTSASEPPKDEAEKPVPVAAPVAQTETPEVKKAEPVEEPKVEESVPAVTPAETTTTAEETPKVEEAAVPAEPIESAEQKSVSIKEEESISEPKEESESAETPDDGEQQEENVPEPFNLSQFFNRLETAKELEDPFSFDYPYPYTHVDARWKAGNKKYRYDPQFLLQFQENIQYPIDEVWKTKLEMMGITTNVYRKQAQGGQARGGAGGKFGNNLPGRFNGPMSGARGQFGDGRQNSRSGSKRRAGGPAGAGSNRSISSRKGQSKRGGREREKEEEAKPAEDVKPLEKSANRWVPRSRAKQTEAKVAPDGSEILEEEDVERKVKSLLNKLTLEMFEPITDDILKIANQSQWEENAKTVKQIISLTFAKACDEPYWSSMYAQFCAKICTKLPEEIKDETLLLRDGSPAKGGDLARRLLLATCQTEYEKGWVDKLPTNPDGTPLEPEMMSDEYYAMAAAKRRGLGLVKFIGHLYILNMLNDHVITHCIKSQSSNVEDPSEESLENLTQLIRTVGPKFETNDRNKIVLNLVFENIQSIIDTCKLSSRIKFMLMDLQDIRDAKWVSLKPESGPKTIQEVHDEAEIKRMEEERAQIERRRRNKHNFNDSRSNSSRGGSSWGANSQSSILKRGGERTPSKDSKGFTSVSSRSQSNRPTPDASFTSSNMSPRENSKRADSQTARSNMFAALGGDHDNDDNEEDHNDNKEAGAAEI